MKGDFSRLRFRPHKNYTSVLQQQGRVALDADANEQSAIYDHLRTTETVDVVGKVGGPVHDEGFAISVSDGAIQIGKGRYYVDGILCTNEHPHPYSEQPFLVEPDPTDHALLSSLQQGSIEAIEVYLKVWRRLVTALDDPGLREPALGLADTTVRLQTVWQVVAANSTSLQPLSGAVAVTNGSSTVIGTGTSFTTALQPGEELIFASDTTQTPYQISTIGSDSTLTLGSNYAGTTGTTSASVIVTIAECCGLVQNVPANRGKLNAQTGGSSGDCSCEPTPAAGYRGLENQLYRVEIHHSGDESIATFKWSRENGSVVAAITSVSGNQVWVDSVGPDANLGFAGGEWVEITDDTCEFGQPPNQPGNLYYIQSVTGLCLTMAQPVSVDPTRNARMRRWDQFGSSATSDGVSLSTQLIPLENGIDVEFSSGHYESGDYWLIPARTATGDIEWPPPGSSGSIYLPPHRIEVFRAPLAYITWDSSSNQAVVEDCRVAFSPLSEVDIAFHNKHLHGWGIVCGLQVNCGADRTQVTVRRGYAIDCDGEDVLLNCDSSVDVVTMAQSQSLLDANGNGEVSLILKSDGSFAIEKEDPSQETLESFFKYTFWWDFWQKCIQPLIAFLKSQFTSGSGSSTTPVGPAQQRTDTFINLLYQLVNPVNGQYLFISPEEDKILSDFNAGLKQVLASRTFCGMFDQVRPFPAYPFASLNMHSLFGSGNHNRIRVNPNGPYAYTVGTDNMIHVYDLTNMVMVAQVAFPAQKTAVVQDVAVSPDGTQLFAIATLGSNSLFAMASVQGGNLTWSNDIDPNGGSAQALSNVQFKTLAIHGGLIYAVATGQFDAAGAPLAGVGGLYAAKLGARLPSAPSFSYPDFALFGHLVIGSVRNIPYAYMTASRSTGTITEFDVVVAQNLDGQGVIRYSLNYQGTRYTGTQGDDIAVAVDPAGNFTNLYVVVDPTTTNPDKQLFIYSLTAAGTDPRSVAPVDLGSKDAVISLAFNPASSFLLIGYSENNWISVLDPSKNELYKDLVPSEVSPQSIAVGPSLNTSNQTVYALNVLNSTIGAIPAAMLVSSPSTSVSLSELATYRNDVLDAFADLLGLILQDLKDCFCERFLVDCPDCDGEEKIYLGDVQITGSEVFRICNFSRRRYVKSFPTYGYWLSIVPILPLVKWAIGRFCCTILPDFFSKYQAGEKVGAVDRYTGDQILSAKNFVQQVNINNFVLAQRSKLSTTSKLGVDSISAAVFNPKPAEAVQIKQGDVVGQQSEAVTQRLASANVVVDSIQPYNPSAAATNVTSFLGAPTSLQSGSHVTLYEQNGVVKYYTLTPTPTPAVQNLTTQVQAQQATLSSLSQAQQTASSTLEQAQQLIARQQQTITAHEQEIATLKTSLSQLQQAQAARDQTLTTLQAQVQGLLEPPVRE